MIWLKLELTKYFGIIALVALTFGRYVFASFGVKPFAAPLIFPFISLKIHSRIVRLLLTVATQLFVSKQIYPNFGQPISNDYPSYDFHFQVGLSIAFFVLSELVVPNIGLQDRKKTSMAKLMESKDKKPVLTNEETDGGDTHIIYFMLFNLIAYFAFLQVAINFMRLPFSPLHCEADDEKSLSDSGYKCEWKEVQAVSLCVGEFGYLIGIIFLLGPIRLFFKIKEGKTSLE